MEQAAILMLIFSAAILIYAGLLAVTKDYKMLPIKAQIAVKPKDEKAYAAALAKCIALTAAVPALTALVMFWHSVLAAIVFVVGLALALWAGTKIMKGIE